MSKIIVRRSLRLRRIGAKSPDLRKPYLCAHELSTVEAFSPGGGTGGNFLPAAVVYSYAAEVYG